MKRIRLYKVAIFCGLMLFCLFTAKPSTTENLTEASAETTYQPPNTPTYGNWTYNNGSYCNSYGLAMGPDGGYVMTGYQVNYQPMYWDAWLVKVDSNGVMQWNRTYGALGTDQPTRIINCSDGGYAFTGYTTSYGSSINDWDMWLVKINANGTLQWMRTYGGPGQECGLNLIATSDGGYLVVGDTNSYGEGNFDFYIVKTDSMGSMQWSKTYGNGGYDAACGVVEIIGKCYVIAGSTNTSQSGFRGWLIKLDSEGNQIWNQTYRGPEAGSFFRIVKTSTGFTMAGRIGELNKYHSWLVNTDENGTVNWSRTYGENSTNIIVNDFVMTTDEGYALTGNTYAPGTSSDLFLLKIDKHGNAEWNQTLGGSRYDEGWAIIQTAYGYALGGNSESYNKLTTSQYWFILTDSNGRFSYNLTTHTSGQGSVSPGNQTYMSGTAVNLVAVAADGWMFKGWSGDASGTSNPTIIMNSDKTVTASFTQIPYNLTIITVGSGAVYPDNQSYNLGATVNLTAINAAGWSFSGWSGDVSGTTNTTIIINANKIVTATFIQDKTPSPTPLSTAPITPSPAPSGSSAPTPTTSAAPTNSSTPPSTTTPSTTTIPPTVSPSPTPSIPELSSIVLVPILISALLAMALKMIKLKKVFAG